MKFNKSSLKTRMLLGVTVFALTTASCAPIVRQNGHLMDQRVINNLEVGLITQREVSRMMGAPSTVGDFDGETWYYITSVIEQYAWRAPTVTNRQIVAVKFDNESHLIASVDKYGIEDGRIINFSKRETPTKGRELSFLEQLFGNVGRVSAEDLTDPNNQNQRN
ncbi:MAG: outer membrane protein assembly factor BamE [Alphaproteobacteria bacterium]|nr:MAG: outer membrane protein assembly factor BamE [Alphaproteobacteria bacterium]